MEMVILDETLEDQAFPIETIAHLEIAAQPEIVALKKIAIDSLKLLM
jgi:hypothetical protein